MYDTLHLTQSSCYKNDITSTIARKEEGGHSNDGKRSCEGEETRVPTFTVYNPSPSLH